MTFYADNRSGFETDQGFIEVMKKTALETLKLEGLSDSCEISLSFCEPEEIRGLNKRFRGKDSETDVLSFPAGGGENEKGERLLGDIVICPAVASATADALGQSLLREAAFLCCHSMLHLLGYDHMNENDEDIMTKKQREVMSRIFQGGYR